MQTEIIRPHIYQFEEKIKNDIEFGFRMIEAAAIATCDLNIEEIKLIEAWIANSKENF